MFKASMELGRITPSLRLTFSTILNVPEDFEGKDFKRAATLMRYRFDGSDYLKIRPASFIGFDITPPKLDRGFDRNNSGSITEHQQFFFIKKTRKFLTEFQKPGVFRYTDETLTQFMVDPNKREEISFTMDICGNRKLRIEPAVLVADRTGEMSEGIILYLNDMYHYTYLTYEELEFLQWKINRIKMSVLSLMLLSEIRDAQALTVAQEGQLMETPHFIEKEEEEDLSIGSIVRLEPVHTIPDI